MFPSMWSRSTSFLKCDGLRCFKTLSSPSRGYAEKKNWEQQPDPHQIECDYVGPPDAESNLRLFVHRIPPEETKLAKNYRLKLLEVEAWNLAFWREHNRRFYKEKDEFIREHQLAHGKCNELTATPSPSSSAVGLSDDEMSVFYKRFLDKNHQMHVQYNLMWYRKNFELLIMAFRVEMERFMSKFGERKKDPSTKN